MRLLCVTKLWSATVASTLAAMLMISAAPSPQLTPNEAEAIAVEGYIYGYPMITMDLTRQVMTNVAEPTELKAPMGQFANIRTYPNASFRDVTAPNADTLYSSAWIDVGREPIILHVPNEDGRYYLMPMLSAWTDVFAAPGSRTTGTEEGNYAITGPGWKGTLPNGVKELKSPTDIVWILGRTYSTGTPKDYEAVHRIQDQYSLTPLSSFGKLYRPPPGLVDPNVDTRTPVREQVNQLGTVAYFKRLAELMKNNPAAAAADAPLLEKLAKIGFVPGQSFEPDASISEALTNVPKLAQERIMGDLEKGTKDVNGWRYPSETGMYGTDYLNRALVSAVGLGANLPQDAIYPLATKDSHGRPLNGSYDYVIRFKDEEAPPVQGFWSITMYNPEYFFVANPLNRYTVSVRNNLKDNKDGSVDLYIQNITPGRDRESNWLPAPKGDFVLMLRMYWPKKAVLDGSWKPPAIERVN
ncbi:MAG: DUF1254 domain-containing protein [Chlamydiales bacterium]|nr:DUF1254 domain-containing protein [Chlamydiales bacterium]